MPLLRRGDNDPILYSLYMVRPKHSQWLPNYVPCKRREGDSFKQHGIAQLAEQLWVGACWGLGSSRSQIHGFGTM